MDRKSPGLHDSSWRSVGQLWGPVAGNRQALRLSTHPGTWRDEATDKTPVVSIRQLHQSKICTQAIKPTRLP